MTPEAWVKAPITCPSPPRDRGAGALALPSSPSARPSSCTRRSASARPSCRRRWPLDRWGSAASQSLEDGEGFRRHAPMPFAARSARRVSGRSRNPWQRIAEARPQQRAPVSPRPCCRSAFYTVEEGLAPRHASWTREAFLDYSVGIVSSRRCAGRDCQARRDAPAGKLPWAGPRSIYVAPSQRSP